jgi:hypothetical protein
MEKFPRYTQPRKNESPKKTYWRETLAVALASTIGVGIAEYIGNDRSPSYEADWDGIRTETPFDLQPLENIARAKLEIKGDKYIFHIGQIHASSSLEFTKKWYAANNIPLEHLVECQKQVEKTIIFLREKYGIEAVFEESLIPEDANYYQKLREELQSNPLERGAELKSMGDDDLQHKLPAFLDEYRAHDLLFAEQGLKNTLAGKEVTKNPLIAGDTRYVWGAPYVMAARGEIRLLPAEDVQANSAAVTAGLKSKEGHEIRQDAAVELIKKHALAHPESVALVYGAAHDFTHNVEKANDSMESSFGLIRIDPHACK